MQALHHVKGRAAMQMHCRQGDVKQVPNAVVRKVATQKHGMSVENCFG